MRLRRPQRLKLGSPEDACTEHWMAPALMKAAGLILVAVAAEEAEVAC